MTTIPTLTNFHPAPSLSDAATLKQRITDTLGDICVFVPEMQSVITAQNTLSDEIEALAQTAIDSAYVASSAQNFQGTWTNQTTQIGQSWAYSGKIYAVLIVGNTSPISTPSNWLSLSEFVSKVTSTDNAIARFNGTTGAIQNSGVVISDNGNLIIGTTTDNGVDKLLVNGSMSRLSKSFNDFNTAFTLTTRAIYEGTSSYNPSNKPSTGDYWWFVKSLCLYSGSAYYVTQIATSLTGRICTRYSSDNGSSWSAWVEK